MTPEERANLRGRIEEHSKKCDTWCSMETSEGLWLFDALDKAEGDNGQLAISVIKMGVEIARLRAVLKEIKGDIELIVVSVESGNLSPFAVNLLATIGSRIRNGLLYESSGLCGASHAVLRDGMSVRFECQRPIGHDDAHSFTSRGGTTTMWPRCPEA